MKKIIWHAKSFEHTILSSSPMYEFGEMASQKLVKFLNKNNIQEFVVINQNEFGILIVYKLVK